MGKIADKILALSKKHLEDKDRRGEPVKDFRDSKHLGKYIDNAERAGVVAVLKGSAPSDDEPMYQDGIQAFMGSREFSEYLQVGGGTSKTFAFDPSRARNRMESKAPNLTTISDIRANLTTERVGEPIRLGVRQTRLREYFAQIPMSGSAVTTMRETGFTNSASGRPENVDPANQVAAASSVIATDWYSLKAVTIDHTLEFPQELLEDLPALEAYFRERGVDGLDDTEDAYIVAGAGEGSNEFLGITTDPNVPTYKWSDGDSEDNMADAVLGAHIAIMAAEFVPDINLLSVRDHAAIMKLKDENGNYLFPAAHRDGSSEFALWGIPTARTTALSTGTGITGAARRAAEYRPRKSVGFRITDAHGTNFKGGVLCLVIERRAAFGVNRPESFREIEFDNAPV